MPARFRFRSCQALALAAAVIAAPLFAASAAQATENLTCSLVATGPAGAEGDILRVLDTSHSVTHIYRQGAAIVVSNNADVDPAVCSGGAPTVTNIDRIEYSSADGVPFINYLGDGPLAPGASPETGPAEIEIAISEGYEPKVLNISGTADGEEILVGQLGRDKVGVDLNADALASAATQDADVTIVVPERDELAVRVGGRGGDDNLSALGGASFTGKLSAERLTMAGGPGNDTLSGGPGRDLLRGDDGDDLLFGGLGRDRLSVGPGSDVARGGPGPDQIENMSSVGGIADDLRPDRVFGGAGDDSIDVFQGLAGDRVDCGPGRDDGVSIDAGDQVQACERVGRH
jgi:Ca2+-binding RTX toxin-like protein